jgi:hypothetical protein
MFTTEIERLVEMTDLELHEHVRTLELEHRTLEARLTAAIAVSDARQLNAAIDGHRTMKSYLRAELNYSSVEAARRLQTAKALDARPEIGDAWINGHIGAAQVAKLASTHANTRIRDRFDTFLPLLLEQAEQLPYSDFETCVNTFVSLADEDGTHDNRDHNITARRARVAEVAGTLDISVFGGDALTAAEIVAIHQCFIEHEFARDVATRRDLHGDDADHHDLPRTHTQRSYDALIEIFRRATHSTVEATPLEPVVNILIDAGTFGRMQADAGLAPTSADGEPIDPFTGFPDPSGLLDDLLARPEDLGARRCETSTGTPLHPHDVLRAALAGHVRRVVVDTDNVIIDMGRTSRLYTGSARIAAKLLVRRCQRPGCELPATVGQVDHNHEWNEHGETTQANAGVMCGPDNREKHKRGWKRRRAANNNTYTIREDGTLMLPVGARTPTIIDADADNDNEADPDDPGRPSWWNCFDDPSWSDPEVIEQLAQHTRQRLVNYLNTISA